MLLLGTLAQLVSLVAAAPAGASAQSPPASSPSGTAAPAAPGTAGARVAPLDVVEVNGRIDGIVADFVHRSLGSAERAGSQLLVVQLDTPDAIVSTARLDDLMDEVARSAVPVAVWVGPSGAAAEGRAIRLLRAAAVSGMANGAHVGTGRGACPECRPNDPLRSGSSLNAARAGTAKAVDLVTPTLGDFIVQLDGMTLRGATVHTAEVVERDGQPRREPIVQVRFSKLDLVGRVLHSTTNPWVAYLLLVVGLLLILFEFYSVGIGIAGLTGAVTVAIASYGLGALGARPIGLVLIGLAVFGFGVDVQAGVPRVWTAIGTVSLLLGSWQLFPSDRSVSWVAIVLVLAGTLVFVLRGMTTMVRSRFATAVINRDAMVGQAADVVRAIDREGTVRLQGALWKARSAGGRRLKSGTAVRVVAIDGLALAVEPGPEGDVPPPARSGSEGG